MVLHPILLEILGCSGTEEVVGRRKRRQRWNHNTRENGLRFSCIHPFLPPKTMLLRQWLGQVVLTLFVHTLLPLTGCIQPPEHWFLHLIDAAEIPLDRCWGIVFLTGTQAFLMQMMILREALLSRHLLNQVPAGKTHCEFPCGALSRARSPFPPVLCPCL